MNTVNSYIKLTFTDAKVNGVYSKLNYYKYLIIPGINNAQIDELTYMVNGDTLEYNGYFVANVGLLFTFKEKTYVNMTGMI